jgi:hypothetical protein
MVSTLGEGKQQRLKVDLSIINSPNITATHLPETHPERPLNLKPLESTP